MIEYLIKSHVFDVYFISIDRLRLHYILEEQGPGLCGNDDSKSSRIASLVSGIFGVTSIQITSSLDTEDK